MSFTSWMDRKASKLRWYDIGVIKIAVAAFVLLVAKLWPPLLSLGCGWYAAVFAAAYATLLWRTFLTPDL